MSQMSVATTVAKRSTEGSRRTSLRVVTPEERTGSAWFPTMCVALLLAGLGAVLGLNTAMAQDSFEVTALEAESARLADTQDSLTHSINSRSAPQRLGREAGDLGMVPAGSAAFIDLDEGAVLGVATTAKKPDGFTVDGASTATADEADQDAKPSDEKQQPETKRSGE
ncbi:hypothetical protein [Janibacter sp. GS2]|uniref:hypothetical protein n=1 Tax=Janibacter sp. GS2 TaxID=3442646 RepID=UPI003EB84DFB